MASRHIHNTGRGATDPVLLISNSIEGKTQLPSIWETSLHARDSDARSHCSFGKSGNQQYPELKISVCPESIITKKCGGYSFISQKTWNRQLVVAKLRGVPSISIKSAFFWEFDWCKKRSGKENLKTITSGARPWGQLPGQKRFVCLRPGCSLLKSSLGKWPPGEQPNNAGKPVLRICALGSSLFNIWT